MKEFIRKIFSPILDYFENQEGEHEYKPSHRVVLFVLGSLFLLLSVSVGLIGVIFSQVGAAIPGLVFLVIGVTSLAVGYLGSDRAVSKIWRNR